MRSNSFIVLSLVVYLNSGCGCSGGDNDDSSKELEVVAVQPPNGAKDVSGSTDITVFFNQDVRLTPDVQGKDVIRIQTNQGDTLSATIKAQGRTMHIDPVYDFKWLSTVTVRLGDGIQTLAGKPYSGDFSWSFTISLFPEDRKGPEVASVVLP